MLQHIHPDRFTLRMWFTTRILLDRKQHTHKKEMILYFHSFARKLFQDFWKVLSVSSRAKTTNRNNRKENLFNSSYFSSLILQSIRISMVNSFCLTIDGRMTLWNDKLLMQILNVDCDYLFKYSWKFMENFTVNFSKAVRMIIENEGGGAGAVGNILTNSRTSGVKWYVKQYSRILLLLLFPIPIRSDNCYLSTTFAHNCPPG